MFISKNRTAFGKRLIDLPLMRRQLMKMLVTAEQGRSMVFHTAKVLQASDAGDAKMAKVLRILTPLIKFRTCRDARKVAGDAMEVRGGCGYIEEWSDARVLRDAHLGSIWEGTSNIVALDVARATRREGEVRAAASAVYNAVSATVLAWEDAQLSERAGYAGDRLALARAVVAHKLTATDPLGGTETHEAADAALLDRALAEAELATPVAAQ